jgi:hypothetical protein
MPLAPLYLGEVVHHTKQGKCHWHPDGAVYRYAPAPASAREIEDFGAGDTEAARIFVGFNVGGTPTHTLSQVADAVYEIRKRQGASGDASLLLQRGIYESDGERVDEDSAQVVILNLTGEKNFTAHMLALAERLREQLSQERVIVEMQKGGVVQHVYSATDPAVIERERQKAGEKTGDESR